MNQRTISDFIFSLPNTKLEYPFETKVAVYKVEDEMFAILEESKKPLRISLKCDPHLSKLLREKYVEVMPGHNLSKKDWNTIILSGELPWEEIQGLIRHSYELSVKDD
ncbi:MAG: MmcQ/YjbR family DNA-binding protein [Chlamydiae bacterium]|nr:MmcQ/YjbR family DNA-binding protein [Chlamydiota bacterium]